LARRLEVRRAIEAGSVLFEIRPIESSGNSETFFADDIRPCLSIGDDQRLETAEIMVAAQEDQDLARRICSEMVSAALIRLQARQMNSVEHGVVIHCPACGLDGIREASDLWDQFVTAAATGVPFWVNLSLDFLHEGISTSIKQLHSVGVRFATSLGVGAGSLQQLRQLPFDLLYIEESFVREIETDKNDEAIVMAIASLGESLGLKCVAEGVRAASTRNRLAELGVQLVIPYDDP